MPLSQTVCPSPQPVEALQYQIFSPEVTQLAISLPREIFPWRHPIVFTARYQ